MSEANGLIRDLVRAMQETIDTLLQLSDEDMEAACSHGCARDGGIRRLLVHNAEHDREHTAAVAKARDEARQMQESDLARHVRDLLHQRVELIGQLWGLPDEALGWRTKGDEWDVREHIEHVLYWERDTMKTVREEQGIAV